MIENLEFQILHLKALGLSDESIRAVRCSSTPENRNPKELEGRIPQVPNRAQSVNQNFTNGSSKDLNQNVTLIQPEVKTGLRLNQGKSRNMGGVSFTCDASPHSPWSIVSSRKSGVGAGLLVHLTAHIAEKEKTTSSTKTNIKTHPSNTSSTLLDFSVFDGFSWTPFQKINFPGTMPLLGTLGGRYE